MQDINSLTAAAGEQSCCAFCSGPHVHEDCPDATWRDWLDLAEDEVDSAKRICLDTPQQDRAARISAIERAESALLTAKKMLEPRRGMPADWLVTK